MASQYEVEHNVQLAPSTPPTATRRINMSTFFSLLDRVSLSPPSTGTTTTTTTRHTNPHATPTLPDLANVFRLVQDQMTTLAATAPTPENRSFLMDLVSVLEGDVDDPPTELQGVDQAFVDALERVDRRALRPDDDCPICKVAYCEDAYCLVVELPCRGAHRFDLECVGPWLRSKGTCPMCREEVGGKKVVVEQPVEGEDEDEDDMDMMYA